jgi:potassium channel subfamily K
MNELLHPRFYRAIIISGLSLVICAIIFNALEPEWNYFDAVYFCAVTLTTVGYGDLTPTNSSSRLFTIIYIGLAWFLLGRVLSAAVLDSVDAMTQRMSETLSDAANAMSPHIVTKRQARKRALEIKITTLLSVFAGCVIGGTFLFLLAGNDIVASLFAAFSTLSTVGFGDFVFPATPIWRIVGTFYVVTSTITTAWCVSTLVEVVSAYKQDEYSRQLMKKKLTRSERLLNIS